MYREHGGLTPAQKAAVLEEIKVIRATLTELRDRLGLSEKTTDIQTAIWSQCSWFWESLVELESKRLRRYGDVPRGFGKYFDPKLEHIIDRLTRISEIVHEQSPEPGA